MNAKIPKVILITKLECLPCNGAKFILQKLKLVYNFEVELIYLNAANKQRIYQRYNLDNMKIPSVFIEDKLVSFGVVKEKEIKDELEKFKLL